MGTNICFWGTGQARAFPLPPPPPPPAPLPATVPLAPALPRHQNSMSPTAEHWRACCTRWHAQLKPVRVSALGAAANPYHVFSVSSLLPHTMQVRAQRDIWFLAIKTGQFGLVGFFLFPSSCPSDPSSPYPAAPGRGGQRSVWMLGRGSPQPSPPATTSQQSPGISPAQMGCCSHKLPPGRDGK